VPSYFQILTAIISYAVAHPEAFKNIWASIIAAYLASRDLIAGIKRELPEIALPGDGVLRMEGIADTATLEAEQRLEALINPGIPGVESLKFPGGVNLRTIITWLRDSEIGKALLDQLLKRLGS